VIIKYALFFSVSENLRHGPLNRREEIEGDQGAEREAQGAGREVTSADGEEKGPTEKIGWIYPSHYKTPTILQ